MMTVTSQLKGTPFFKEMKQWALTNIDPQLAARMAPDVIIDGQKVNAATAIQEAQAKANIYFAKAHGLGQPDTAEQKLFRKIFQDPTESFTSPQQTEYQAKKFLNDTFNSINERATVNGLHLDPEIYNFAQQKAEVENIPKEQRSKERVSAGISGEAKPKKG
jgi:hypothetical protein